MFDFDPAGMGPEALERIGRRAEDSMRALAAAMENLTELSGEGEAAEGRVRAVVESDGTLRELRFDPRAMRLGSEELAQAATEAVRLAQRAVRERVEESVRGLAALPDDLEAAGRQLDEVREVFSAALAARRR
ncbi:hypothetical protein GCM10010404_82680 [Nonomuraea africana]|uniref:DNA-binding protein YbaB n=1 Tax=Nonomuraea africana TaxID=46171 RepID=A0ABR9K815_9ACTN|nr:YbaB/EbfC family nucleoid-associated protein [Nonomuraea africana]MBE1558139.1 DNA-binding protein YbaB [Nonomuraea africana]